MLFEKSNELAPFLFLRVGCVAGYLLHELVLFESIGLRSAPVATPKRHTYSQDKRRNHLVAVGSYPTVGLSALVATNGQPTNRTTHRHSHGGLFPLTCFSLFRNPN